MLVATTFSVRAEEKTMRKREEGEQKRYKVGCTLHKTKKRSVLYYVVKRA